MKICDLWEDDGEQERAGRVRYIEDEYRLPNLHTIVPPEHMHHMVVRGQKNVTIYRGVPIGVNEIRPGDWVALSASYAQAHERGKVLSMRVPAEDVAWAGTDKNEYFYVPRGAMSESDTSGGKRKLPGRVGEPKMTESHQPTTDQMDEALWWVSRWVSGSETDPDWDGGSETMTMDEAFIFLSETIKSKFKNIPVLYRAIIVSKREAEKIIKTKRLSVNHRSFQSFTTSAKIAIEACYDIDSFIGKGNVRLLVEVHNPPVLFALLDLKHTSIWGQLADWHHQGEVFVDGRKPITIEKATIIKNA